MKKKFLVTAAALFAGLFTLLANSASASACLWWLYQPEEPKSLRKA